MENKKLFGRLNGDPAIWLIVLILAFLGLIEIYSSTTMLAWKEQAGDSTYYILRHMVFLTVGLCSMHFLTYLSYKNLSKVITPMFWGSVVLLGLTLMLGDSTNDAKRWLYIPGTSFQFQTSDLAKLALMLYLAKVLSTCKSDPASRRAAFFQCVLAVGMVCVLIMPANLSTALLIAGTSVLVMLVGQIPLKWIGIMVLNLSLFGVLALGFCKVAGIHTRMDTWVSRLSTYISDDADRSDEDFQAEEAKIAIARGGLLGVGPGNSLQRNSIPHPYSDFIFAIVVEECGIWGCIIVLGGYIVFLFRCISIVKGLDRTFPAFIVVGLSLNIVLQAVSHVLVVTNVLPVTGQPLPFVSMGGTSLLLNSVSVGIILNISRYSGKKETVEDIEQDQETEEVADYPFIAG